MGRILRAAFHVSSLWCVIGCSGGGGQRDRLLVGSEAPPADGAAGVASKAGSGPRAGDGASGKSAAIGSDSALEVAVEDIKRLKIEIVTLRCAGDCADVIAVAHGGNSPYEFAWEDGSTDAARTLCPDATTKYSVTATDTAIDADEFSYEGAEASADVTANVLDCPAELPDAGMSPPGDGVCVENPSLEGAAFPGTPPDWTYCLNSPDINPSFTTFAASDGETYVGLGAGTSALETMQATLCAPLKAGEPLPVSLDLTMSTAFGPFGTATIQLWGATSSCEPEELLWESHLLTQFDEWKTYCGTLTPSKDYPYLVVVPASPTNNDPSTAGGFGYVIVDNFGSTGACTE